MDFCGFEVFILERTLKDSINAWILRHIMCIGQLDKYRVWTKSSGVFEEYLSTYKGSVYPNGCHFFNGNKILHFIHYIYLLILSLNIPNENVSYSDTEIVLPCCFQMFFVFVVTLIILNFTTT